MSADRSLADAPVRRRIAEELGPTLFVDAGAGSGKTRALVDRMLAHVERGDPITSLAAITFTEKAAAELRHRLRDELGQVASGQRPGDAARAELALDDLDRAAISTLHAFAQRLLLEHPIHAELPPNLGVLDEIASDLRFEQRWQPWFRNELASDPGYVRTLQLAVELGVNEAQLRELAQAFEDNWDLVLQPGFGVAPAMPELDCTAVVEAAQLLLDAARTATPGDLLRGRIEAELPEWLDGLRAALAADDELAVVAALRRKLKIAVNAGKGPAWARTSFASVDAAKAAIDQLTGRTGQSLQDGVLAPLVECCLQQLGDALAGLTRAGVEERRREGRLSFHDLLVLARQLLRNEHHGEVVRRELAGRYRALLIDEFQDTDPLQLEIAELIATAPDASRPEPGRLFFVGDPKQSIYRFRRADIDLYLRTPSRVGADTVSLTTNFRTNAPVLDWVNRVFARIITAEQVDGVRLQPPYEPLDRGRDVALEGPAVLALGVEPHDDAPRADELRVREASSVAGAVARILDDGWTVEDRDARGAATPRPARLGDIAILIPTRLGLPALQHALDRAGIAHRTEAGSLVYATDEARTLLLALRAVDDPSDELAVVSTLRSPLYGCSDVELYRWRVERDGRWNPLATLPERRSPAADDPVWDALTDLRRRVDERPFRTPSQLLDSLVRDRRFLESALADRGPRDAWRRVRFVVDHARAWSEAGGVGLRTYLDWAQRQGGQTGRVAEVVLPETDEDAVRIMTIHAAKGLEFPITIVAGLTTQRRGGGARVDVLWDRMGGGRPEIRLRKGVATAGFDERRLFEEQMSEHEQRRLLYVACTRARDHLVVSLHRTTRQHDTSAAVLAGAALDGLDDATFVGEHPPGATDQPATSGATPQPSRPSAAEFGIDAWRAERAGLLRRASRASATSPTALATLATPDGEDGRHEPVPDAADAGDLDDEERGGLLKDPVDLDLPPWRKGRYGTAIGRAVHAVLQAVDLGSGAGVDDLARAQAAAEGVIGQEATVAALVRSALASPTVRVAATRPHWRELYVGTSIGGIVLEGYVDLLVRTPDGLVVVDHKTDHVRDAADVAAKVARYRLQAAAYAVALESLLGEEVVECRLVFCRDGEPIDVTIPDLAAARAEVRERLAAATTGDDDAT